MVPLDASSGAGLGSQKTTLLTITGDKPVVQFSQVAFNVLPLGEPGRNRRKEAKKLRVDGAISAGAQIGPAHG